MRLLTVCPALALELLGSSRRREGKWEGGTGRGWELVGVLAPAGGGAGMQLLGHIQGSVGRLCSPDLSQAESSYLRNLTGRLQPPLEQNSSENNHGISFSFNCKLSDVSLLAHLDNSFIARPSVYSA